MSKTQRKLRAGVALHALVLVGASATVLAAAAPAHAQDYTSGAIQGSVSDENGTPVANATVTVRSDAQGVTRTARTSSSGAMRIAGLPSGSYSVTAEVEGKPGWRAEGVSIVAGQTAQIEIKLSAGEEIVVTGASVTTASSGGTTGLSVDVEDFIKNKPLGRDLTSVVLLAPGTAVGDTAFGNLPSIGGASVAENAYYLNGLNLTNFNTYLGSAEVPFWFYKSVDTQVGGFSAEYGRATGGIVNAVSKSGSNTFSAGVHVEWAPNFLRSLSPNLLYWDGERYSRSTNRSADSSDSVLTAVEAGGPIIRDRLFFYGLAQFRRTRSTSVNVRAGTATRNRNDDPFWGVKLDAYPIDSQHLEFTIFDTRSTTQQSILDYSETNFNPIFGAATTVRDNPGGGLNFVGKYTSHLTDFLTMSAAYGRVRDRSDFSLVSGDFGTPYFVNSSGNAIGNVRNGGLFTSQALGSVEQPYDTQRKFFRADADVLFSLFGDHHVRFGYDQEDNRLRRVTIRTGGTGLRAAGRLSDAAFNAQLGGAGYSMIARAPDANGNVVELNYYNTGGAFLAKNQAYYIQDAWKPIDRLTVNLGVRRDDFRINKPSGSPLADLKKNYAPRLSATYDLWGDRSGQLFGSYGWYYLPVASNTAYRQGAPSYYFRQRYNFSGVDANGLPILTGLVTNRSDYASACPFALLPNGATTNCNVTGDGADVDLSQAISTNLKATRESEFIIGYRHTTGLWKLGLSYTHRNLDRSAEDSAIDAAVNAYCTANNVVARPIGGGAAVPCSRIWDGFHQYVINNPGKDITVNLLASGYDINNRTVTLTADQLGYGKARRTYDAVTFEFDRRSDGLFSFGGSYTWSKSKGNSEGFVQSDFGQSDAGITQDFDQPGFVPGAYGYLPSDRRHNFKLYGDVTPTKNFAIGLNLQVASPRPLSCFGYNPTDKLANGYGAASHYCGGKLSPRGSAQQSDWVQTTNVSLRYNVKFGDRDVTLRADVFNLLNSRAVTERYEFGDLDVTTNSTTGLPSSYIPDPDYGLATAYQSPRYVRLGVDIAF